MLQEVSGFVFNNTGHTNVFSGGMTANNYITYKVPKSAIFLNIYIQGAGSGGGGGASGASLSQRGGGGGGGGGGYVTLVCPTFLLPSTLYLQVGAGGLGGAADTDGSQQGSTLVAFDPDTTNTRSLLAIDNPTSASTGKKGTSTVGGAKGSSTIMSDYTNAVIVFNQQQASSGSNGSATTTPTAIDIASTVSLVYGGAGGAGVTNGNAVATGGGYTMSGSPTFFVSSINGGAGALAGGSAGDNGYTVNKPFTNFGGAGGGSSGSSGTGGAGGHGAIGCGGGGGGGGVTGGAGGNGGDGIIIITWW